MEPIQDAERKPIGGPQGAARAISRNVKTESRKVKRMEIVKSALDLGFSLIFVAIALAPRVFVALTALRASE